VGRGLTVARGIGRVALAAVLVAAAAPPVPAAAQSRTAGWASLGLGRAFLGNGGDIAVHLEAVYQFGSSLVAVRAASAASNRWGDRQRDQRPAGGDLGE
jgi:hypothetical protein